MNRCDDCVGGMMRKKHSYMYTVTTKLLLSKERDLTPASKSNRSAFLVPVKGVR